MGVRFPSVGTSTRITNTIVTTAETLLVTTPPLNISLDFAQVFLFWYIALTVGTGGTAVTLNIRRGPLLTSALVNLGAGLTVTAGNSVILSGTYPDIPGAVAGQQYSVSAIVTAATANSTVIDAAMLALAL